MNIFYTTKVLFSLCIIAVYADKPCVPRYMNESVVCVCNSTYCDTLTREAPSLGQYITYTSSKAGRRFSKTLGMMEARESTNQSGSYYGLVLKLQLNRLYQSIEGFGGAVTDSAGINLMSLSPSVQKLLINTYCSEEGIEYNMLRVPIGSTDFSTRPYTYNEYPVSDSLLSNYTLASEDVQYKLPMIKACMAVATSKVEIVSATWAPPKWMVQKDQVSGMNYVNKDFYQVYADYHCKFAELYESEGVSIWGLTPTNEPGIAYMLGQTPFATKEDMSWTTKDMAEFIVNNFGPTIRNCSVEGIKILAVDDQRFTIPLYFSKFKVFGPAAFDYIDGIALHYYSDEVSPAGIIARAMKDYPDKFVLATEACAGNAQTDSPKVDLGSWKRAKKYLMDILEDLNYNIVGWLDWNMCLNTEGGPTWLGNYVDSPIIVDAGNEEFLKQPTFYILGHFSKFIPRGSRRIRAVKIVPAPDPDLDFQDIEATGQAYFDNVAFLTPRGTIVIVIHNDGPSKSTAIQIGDQQISIQLDEESVTTIEFLYNADIRSKT